MPLSLCVLFLLSLPINAFAEVNDSGTVIFSEITALEDGLTVVDEIIEHPQGRSTDKNHTRRKTSPGAGGRHGRGFEYYRILRITPQAIFFPALLAG